MALRRQLTLTREGLYYLAVLAAVVAGAVVREANLMILLAGMLAGPLLISLWLVGRALSHCAVTRQLPENICAGDRLVIEIALGNRHRRRSNWALVVHDAVLHESPGATAVKQQAEVLFPHVEPGEIVRATYEDRLPARGRYRFGPLRLTTRFPLGLFRSQRVMGQEASLIVWPRLGRLLPEWARLNTQREAGSQQSDRLQSRREADFYALRDYRSGDSRRSIHWRSTARRGQIVVRQFDESRSHDVALFVDLYQPAMSSDGAAVEKALSFVGTILADACRRGGMRMVLIIAGGEPLERRAWASQALLRDVLDALALVEPRRQAALPPALTMALADKSPSLPGLLITTQPLDLVAVSQAAAAAGATLPPRLLKVINVKDPELERYFELE